ncbi:MAG: CRISPR-associated endonuclease Cas2 [bacterium]|nr:CRISPR-associated endonuclease Cas2 [bacterium]
MKKLLRMQDILLLGLAGGLDAFIDLKNETRAEVCLGLHGWVPEKYQKSNFNQTVWHSLRTGYIEKEIGKNGNVYLSLTSKGNQKLKRHFSFLKLQSKRWDRKWRMVIFDINEADKKKRDRLRDKLSELGFAMLQESVWITPYNFIADLREFLETCGLEESTYVFETSSLIGGEQKSLAAKIWVLDDLNDEYFRLYNEITNCRGRGKISSEDLVKLREKYLEILRNDPCLPRELLPEVWSRDKVEKELKRMK